MNREEAKKLFDTLQSGSQEEVEKLIQLYRADENDEDLIDLTELFKPKEVESYNPKTLRPDPKEEKEEDIQFSLDDVYARKLFISFAKRHGLKAFRYPKQRRTTIMLRGKPSYINNEFWPEFECICNELDRMLEGITDLFIEKRVND